MSSIVLEKSDLLRGFGRGNVGKMSHYGTRFLRKPSKIQAGQSVSSTVESLIVRELLKSGTEVENSGDNLSLFDAYDYSVYEKLAVFYSGQLFKEFNQLRSANTSPLVSRILEGRGYSAIFFMKDSIVWDCSGLDVSCKDRVRDTPKGKSKKLYILSAQCGAKVVGKNSIFLIKREVE